MIRRIVRAFLSGIACVVVFLLAAMVGTIISAFVYPLGGPDGF